MASYMEDLMRDPAKRSVLQRARLRLAFRFLSPRFLRAWLRNLF